MPNAAIVLSTSGDHAIVAAVAGSSIRVLSFFLTFAGAVNVQFFSDTGGSEVAITGLLYGIGTAPAPLAVIGPEFVGRGLFQTASGKALNLKLSGNVAVGGVVEYELASQ